MRPQAGHSLRPNVKTPNLLPQKGHFLHLRVMGLSHCGHTFFLTLGGSELSKEMKIRRVVKDA